ncbi:MAG: RDD family protein [Gammaproteobacteria bacterium]|nr:RDD family protein [Gammaproteobacteria bacterium]
MNINTQNTQSPGPGAALSRRFAADIYDALLLVTVWMVAMTPIALYVVGALKDPAAMRVIGHISLAGMFLGYFVHYSAKDGQTLGMQAWRLRVVTTTGARLSRGRALARTLLATAWLTALVTGCEQWFSGHHMLAVPLLAIFCAAYFWMLANRPEQALHDTLAGTKVLFVPRPTRRAATATDSERSASESAPSPPAGPESGKAD